MSSRESGGGPLGGRELLQRVTWMYRQWLKEWVRLGGDPDGPEAMYVKKQIAQAEEGHADDAAMRDYYERKLR